MRFEVSSSFAKGNIEVLETVKNLFATTLQDNELYFDFSKFAENNPFNMLLMINSILRFKEAHPEISTWFTPKKEDGYLKHIGFYNAFGALYGNSR